jgi:ABC-2 type transport system permease protein
MAGSTALQLPVTTSTRSPFMKAVRDTWLIYRRSLMLALRNPVWVIIGITQPFFFLLLFGPLLKGLAGQAGLDEASAYNLFVPGLMVQTAFFGTAFAGFGLIAEMRAGVIERMRVSPVSRVAMLLGRSLRDVTVLVGQSLLLVVLAIPFGLTIDPVGLVVALALVGLTGLLIAPLSYSVALITKNEDSFAPLVNFVMLPVLLLSGILLPMSLAPDWLQTIASLNPLSHVVDATRLLFNGVFGDPIVTTAVVLTGGLAALALWVATRQFSRAVA